MIYRSLRTYVHTYIRHRVEVIILGKGSRPFRQSKDVKEGNIAIIAITAIMSITAITAIIAITANLFIAAAIAVTTNIETSLGCTGTSSAQADN